MRFTGVSGYEVIHVYVRLSDGHWSIGAWRLFYSLRMKATEHSIYAHTSYFSTLQKNQSPSRGNIYNNPTPICQTPTRTWTLQSFRFFLHNKSEHTHLPIAFTGVANVYNGNEGTELTMGWNSTELGDLLLKAKFLSSQTT